MDNLLIVFAKAPIPGLVKTRLFPRISHEEAAELYRAFLTDLVRGALAIPDVRVCVAYTPAGSLKVFRGLFGDAVPEYFLQQGKDLGERMRGMFERVFGMGAKRAVIVGSDIPAMPPCYMGKAFHELGRSDVVMGPARDGGYYLIGLGRLAPGLFEGISWSGPGVYGSTVYRAFRLGLSVSTLPELKDVDTFQDLMELRGAFLPPLTQRVVAALWPRLKVF